MFTDSTFPGIHSSWKRPPNTEHWCPEDCFGLDMAKYTLDSVCHSLWVFDSSKQEALRSILSQHHIQDTLPVICSFLNDALEAVCGWQGPTKGTVSSTAQHTHYHRVIRSALMDYAAAPGQGQSKQKKRKHKKHKQKETFKDGNAAMDIDFGLPMCHDWKSKLGQTHALIHSFCFYF